MPVTKLRTERVQHENATHCVICAGKLRGDRLDDADIDRHEDGTCRTIQVQTPPIGVSKGTIADAVRQQAGLKFSGIGYFTKQELVHIERALSGRDRAGAEKMMATKTKPELRDIIGDHIGYDIRRDTDTTHEEMQTIFYALGGGPNE